ncbi:hypothetical protein O181_062151 [Austropuccinia psidii MF-1]|uniref:Integrase catalytic domain-containing protein n=1 Tax=Austropuccinia psidii MF-1 TaxID=1389203 RepID=A0A9Q3EHH4_9BASI|nr:hypothetical protein [Austropuccinia psidii MF-1]
MDTALLIWNEVISHTGLFEKFNSDRDSKFTPALWASLHKLLGTRISFSTAYQPTNNGLAERMIQSLEDMIRILGAHGLELKDSYGFTNDCYTLITGMKLA